MAEWHNRDGGPGGMIYWHVEKKSAVYSQLKSCSSSEAAAMIEGLLRHLTSASISLPARYSCTRNLDAPICVKGPL